MKADLTRNTFHRLKHYSRVVAQQGRVQLDADANEQASITLHYLRRLAGDIFGPCWGPAGNAGFKITALDPKIAPNGMDFAICPGRYYVDGILCELDATPVAITIPDYTKSRVKIAAWTVDGVMYKTGQYVQLFDQSSNTTVQPVWASITDIDYPNQLLTLTDVGTFVGAKPANPRLQRFPTFRTQSEFASPALGTGNLFHVYLDVWERVITWVEDDSIREVALNGPDTSARTKIVWQVKLRPPSTPAGAPAAFQCLTPQQLSDALRPASRGLLRARAKPGQAPTDPCTIAPDASYRGPENQLYRVEIHTGTSDGSGAPPPTFKWSRENGSVVLPIESGGGTNSVVLETLGRDERFGLREGDWVEIQDDSSVLQNRADPLLQVQTIDRGRRTVTLLGSPAPNVGNDPAKHPLLRRWDQKAGDPAEGGFTLSKDNAALIFDPKATQDVWLDLEDGVQVQFVAPAPPTTYRTGDYWLIPARVATGDVEWPTETIPGPTTTTVQPVARAPDGVNHHYAPLAFISIDGTTVAKTLFPLPPLPKRGKILQLVPPLPLRAHASRGKGPFSFFKFGAKGCLAVLRCATTSATFGSPLTARSIDSFVAL